MTKKRLPPASVKPKHEKLPWPGLKAKDGLSRVITRFVKERKETRESETWAQNQIARVLEHVTPETAMALFERALAIIEPVYGPDHRNVLATRRRLGLP